jgi:hypothetical protein
VTRTPADLGELLRAQAKLYCVRQAAGIRTSQVDNESSAGLLEAAAAARDAVDS